MRGCKDSINICSLHYEPVIKKKSNRSVNYEIDRLSRYMKDLIRRNVRYACDTVKAWFKLDKLGKLESQYSRSRYFKIKSVMEDVSEFGKARFLQLLANYKLMIPVKDCAEVKDEELDEMLMEVVTRNIHPETGLWGNCTSRMRELVGKVSELLSYTEAAFDHTAIQFGGSSKKFTRAPRGVKDVFKAASVNTKLCITYVLCASKKYGTLPGYYIIPEAIASKSVLKD